MEFHRRDGFSRDGAFDVDYGKSKDNANEIEIIGSANQRFFEKNNEDMGSKTTISHDTKSISLYERKLIQFDVGSPPLNKRARTIDCSKFIENKFYDLPLLSNGSYTHMTEKLGELTPNGQDEITVASKEEHGQFATFPNPMNEHCIEFLTTKGSESFYSIGEKSHEDRKSEAICLVPGFGSKCILKSSNWKTRLCNKWEINGWCTFGDKCHYAHGSSELRAYDGRLLNKEADSRSTLDAKQTASPATASISSTGAGAHVPYVPRSNRVGVRLQRLPTTMEVPTRRWKGPNKISKIYGDWIDDFQ